MEAWKAAKAEPESLFTAYPPTSASSMEQGGRNMEEESGVSDLSFPGSIGHYLLGSSLPQNRGKSPK